MQLAADVRLVHCHLQLAHIRGNLLEALHLWQYLVDHPVLDGRKNFLFQILTPAGDRGADAHIDAREPLLHAGERAGEIRHHQLEGIMDAVAGFPLVHETAELRGKVRAAVRPGAAHAGEEIHLHPSLVEHRLAHQHDAGIEQVAHHRLTMIEQAPRGHHPEIR